MKNFFKTPIDGCFPTEGQEWLLRACLLPGATAIDAFQEWRRRVDFENIDYGSFRLLALAFTKLPSSFEDPILPRLKGIYRYSWAKNRRALHHLAKLLTQLESAGIHTMLFKGASLTLDVYQDYGARYMDDCDLLVPSSRAAQAIEILRKLGYQQPLKTPKILKAYSHGCNFVSPQGLGVDLHWHLLPHCCNDEDNEEFWKHSRPFALEGNPTRLLDPTDELLSTCVNGMRWSGVSTIRWVMDAVLLLQRHSENIDWERLAAQAERLRLTLYLADTLRYLAKTFQAPIPVKIMERVENHRVAPWQYREYRSDRRPRRWLDEFPTLWHRYHRTSFAERYRLKPYGFLRFVQNYCGLDRLRELPIFLMKRFIPRVRKNVVEVTPS